MTQTRWGRHRQIAGAIYGASAIPTRWLEPLAWRDKLLDTALQLIR